MKNRAFSILTALLGFFVSCSPGKFDLQSGDILFFVGKENSEFVNAIKKSTSGGRDIAFSHAGIVEVARDSIFVIEATSPEGVIRTTLDDFMADALSENGKMFVAVGRLKPKYRSVIPRAVENAKALLGNGYDYAYDEGNNAYYCSELIRFAFKDSVGSLIFPPVAMSFKNKETGQTEPYWIEHYQKLGVPIPEGKPGTNPADMAKSSVIDIVHTYY